jgi:hypothetical protein
MVIKQSLKKDSILVQHELYTPRYLCLHIKTNQLHSYKSVGWQKQIRPTEHKLIKKIRPY